MFSFSAFLLFGKTLQTQCYPSDPTQATETVDDCPGHPNSLSIYYPVLVRNHYYTPSRYVYIQLDITVIYPDGLRNNRIRINCFANAQHCGETSRIINDIYTGDNVIFTLIIVILKLKISSGYAHTVYRLYYCNAG
jgi:hypothetical protein